MSRPLADPVFDIGRDLQRAYEEGYKQGRYDEMVETEMSLPKWIPVSERLPDLKTEVIYSFDGIVSTGYMTDRDYEGEKTESHWEDLESGVTIEPIAWMPLPEPYKGGDTE